MEKFDEAFLQTLVKTLFPSLMSKNQIYSFTKELRDDDLVLHDRIDSPERVPNQYGAGTLDDSYSFDMGFRKGMIGLFEGNSWSVRTMQNFPRVRQTSFTMTEDAGFIAGGRNSSINFLNSTERYSDFYNSWANVNNLSDSICGAGGASLTNNLGMVMGGSNSTNVLNTTVRFSASSNIWTSRSNMLLYKAYFSNINLTNVSYISVGGTNSSVLTNCEKFDDSYNTSLSVLSYPEASIFAAAFSFTNNYGLVSGGSNANLNFTKVVNMFSLSSNSWTSKNNISNYRNAGASISLSTQFGLMTGGYYHAYTWYLFNECSETFSKCNNVWTQCIAMTSTRNYASGMSFSCYSGLIAGGETDPDVTAYLQPPEKYKNGSFLMNWFTNGVGIETLIAEQESVNIDGVWTISTSNLNQSRIHNVGLGNIYTSITFGGENLAGVTLESTEKWNSSSWSLISNMNTPRSAASGIGTHSYSMAMGGTNNSGILATCESWNSTTWATTSSLVRNNFVATSVGKYIDGGLLIGGTNGYVLAYTEKWSGTAWGTTGSINTGRFYAKSVGSTSSAICFGGSNTPNYATTKLNNNEKWNSTAWSTTTSLPEGCYGMFAFGDTLDCISAGGTNSSNATAVVNRWNGSTWTTTNSLTTTRMVGGSSGDFNNGLTFGGSTTNGIAGVVPTTEIWTFKKACPLPAGKDIFVYTQRLSNQKEPINKIYVNAFISKDEKTNPCTYDFSLDDGWTYKEDLPFDTYYESEGIKPLDEYYKLKLRFELLTNPSANTWSVLADTPQWRSWPAVFTLTNDLACMCGGHNGVTNGFTGSNFRYSLSSNSFSSRTAQAYVYYNATAMGITQDQGIVAGGANASTTSIAFTQLYYNSPNTWISRTNMPLARSGCMGFNPGGETNMFACGANGSGYFGYLQRYYKQSNSFTSLTSTSNVRKDGGSCSFTTTVAEIFGGATTGDIPVSINEQVTTSGTWTNKPVMIYAKQDFGSCSLTSMAGMHAGGNNGALMLDCYKYYNSQTSWVARTDIILGRSGVMGWSFGPNAAVMVGGGNQASLQLLKYNSGETILYGFNVIAPIRKSDEITRSNIDLSIDTNRPWTYSPLPDPRFPLKAINPDPTNSETNVPDLGTTLSWEDGSISYPATLYDVYLKKNSSPFGAGDRVVTKKVELFYDPGLLDLYQDYYWRVDSFNDYGSATGDVWTFKTNYTPSGTLGLVGGGWNGKKFWALISWFRTNIIGQNAATWGSLTKSTALLGAGGNNIYALFAGGQNSSPYRDPGQLLQTIYAVTYSDRSAMTLWGNMVHATHEHACCANNTRFISIGGSWDEAGVYSQIYYCSLASAGNLNFFGGLISSGTSDYVDDTAACCNSTIAIFAGGHNAATSIHNNIRYITIATTGNATNFGTLSRRRVCATGCSSSIYGIISGGSNGGHEGKMPALTSIEYIKFATTGSVGNWGNLSMARNDHASTSDSNYGIIAGGYNGGDATGMDSMEYITFSSIGNASTFGDLGSHKYGCDGTSNCHGGLT